MWNVKCFWNPTRTLVNNKDSKKSQQQIRLDLLSVRPLIQFKTQTDAIEIIFDIFEIIFWFYIAIVNLIRGSQI